MDYKTLIAAQFVIMTALFDTAEADNRVFTKDEQAKYDAAEKECERLKAAKKQADALAANKAAVVDDEAAAAAAAADAAAAAKAHKPADNAKAKANKVKAGDALKTEQPFGSLGDMLRDVARAKMGDGEARDRLVKASLNTETGADGNFLVPPDFIGALLEQAEEQSQIFSRASSLIIEGNTANIPAVDESSRADGSRFGGIQVYWLREGGTGTYKQPKFRNLDLKLAKLMGLVSITDEMLEDSALLTSWVQMAFPAEMAFTLDQAFYNGDGNGKPLGIMNSGALVTVAKEGSQVADTVVYENIVKMYARMPASRMARAVWYITQQVMEQLPIMSLAVGSAGGGPVYLPAGGASEKPYSTLMGLPTIPIEQAAALGDLGDIVLADMSDYIAITKGGFKTASSIHVDFDKAKTSFRFIRRVNGAPYTRVKLTSRASATFFTSPYITLAARA